MNNAGYTARSYAMTKPKYVLFGCARLAPPRPRRTSLTNTDTPAASETR
jgi:hypothetical protein